MATHDYVIANGTGAAVRADLNNALAAIVSNNSGTSEPATTYAYQWWADTTNNLLKLRNSANNAWITLRELDGTLLMEDGSASTPGLSFASDTNTGFFSGGADKIGFATGGAERLEIGSSEVVFNDPSNDVDFRVESNGQTHMLFVDAGNDRVGIGTSSPSGLLQLSASSEPSLYFEDTGSSNTLSRIYKAGSALNFNSRHTSAGQFVFNSENSGGTATERARIDTSGRLLVGTSSSRAQAGINFPVFAEGTGFTGLGAVYNANNTTGAFLALSKTRGTSVGSNTIVQDGDQIGEIFFSAADGTDLETRAATIQGVVDGTPGSNDMPGRLVFSTTADGAAGPTERLRIDSSGRVGIGVTTMAGGGGDLSIIRNSALRWADSDGTQRADIYGDSSSNIVFRNGTSSTERMRLDSSGRLLVGTSSSKTTYRLEVVQDSGANFALVCGSNVSAANGPYQIFARSRGSTSSPSVVQNGDTTGVIEFRGYSGAASAYRTNAAITGAVDGTPDSGGDTTDMPGRLIFSTTADGNNSPTERVRIDSSGNVGIGCSDSQAPLEIDTSSANYRIQFTHSAGQNLIKSIDSNHSTLRGLFFDASGHFFFTGGTERVRVTSQGYFKAAHDGGYANSSGTWHEFTGTTPNGYSLRAICDNASPASHYISELKFSATAPNNGNAKFLQCADSGGARINLDSDGGIHNYQSNDGNLCDEREKKNIVSLDTKWDKVKSWELKKFHYNEDADTDDLRYGVIAQQVEEHCPEVLCDWIKQRAEDAVLDDDGNVVTPAVSEVIRKGVKEQQMMWMAIKALQEAQARIETLETKVAALEAG